MNKTKRFNIAFCIVDNMLATSITWPSEMWLAAQSLATSLKPTNMFEVSISTVKTHIDKRALTPHSMLTIKANKDISDNVHYDLIYVPALWRNPQKSIRLNPDFIGWLKSQHDQGSVICGTGTGCCFIAETGLLDNKPATTHWFYFDQFEEKYPLVLLKRDHFITEANNLFCAASINSLADLTIHHIENLYGKATANHIRRHFSHEMRSPYEQLTYSDRSYLNHEDESILHIQLWLQENFDQQISIKELAVNNGMSERTLARKFKKLTQLTPTEYIQTLRVERAKELIQATNLTMTEIAEKTGFYDPSHFSKKFIQINGLSPNKYRKIVRRKLFQK